MRKLAMLAAAAVMACFGFVVDSKAMEWCKGDKLTGGAEDISAGGVTISVAAHALMTGKGLKGQFQYTRENQAIADLVLHGTVQCAGFGTNGTSGNDIAVVTGPGVAQIDDGGSFSPGDWIVIGIEDVAIGSGDKVRVRIEPEGVATAFCDDPASLLNFPGIVIEGEFKVRIMDECL